MERQRDSQRGTERERERERETGYESVRKVNIFSEINFFPITIYLQIFYHKE